MNKVLFAMIVVLGTVPSFATDAPPPIPVPSPSAVAGAVILGGLILVGRWLKKKD